MSHDVFCCGCERLLKVDHPIPVRGVGELLVEHFERPSPKLGIYVYLHIPIDTARRTSAVGRPGSTVKRKRCIDQGSDRLEPLPVKIGKRCRDAVDVPD